MKTKQYGIGLALVLALGAMGAARAETFRCQLADRIASYQQTPCAVPDLPPPPAVAPKPAPKPAMAPLAPRAGDDAPFSTLTPRKREVLDLTARLERCRSDQPGFAGKSDDLYRSWRRRHAATLSEHSHLLATKIRVTRPDAAACSDDWLREIEPLAREPDARFSTVEKTWQAFVAALLAADRAAVMRCVTGPVARAMGDRLERLADADLRRMGANIRELKVLWGDDYDKEALVVHGDRVDGVVFRRNVNEEWKVREMKPAALKPATPRRSSPDS
ncbi:hypothetical protein [Ramlibacter sp. AN1133]|uniref:hypothetical protein n=1 Tax=Ramlibacter sp. AN1133 TaxID=3133429 RepID=UPI0030C194FB